MVFGDPLVATMISFLAVVASPDAASFLSPPEQAASRPAATSPRAARDEYLTIFFHVISSKIEYLIILTEKEHLRHYMISISVISFLYG